MKSIKRWRAEPGSTAWFIRAAKRRIENAAFEIVTKVKSAWAEDKKVVVIIFLGCCVAIAFWAVLLWAM
jgi:hypothetical protein